MTTNLMTEKIISKGDFFFAVGSLSAISCVESFPKDHRKDTCRLERLDTLAA